MASATLIALPERRRRQAGLIQDRPIVAPTAGTFCACPVWGDTGCTSSWTTTAQRTL
jgi:hypothetical protein